MPPIGDTPQYSRPRRGEDRAQLRLLAVVMTILLVWVSGVPMLESTIADRRPGYTDYVRRTSAFLPLPPRRPAGNGP